MKTLQQTAAAFNLFQVQDIPAAYKNDTFDHRIKIGHKEVPEFLTTLKGYEVGLFYECKQDTNYEGKISYYVDHSHILLKKNGSDILLMLMGAYRTDKYYFYPHYDIVRKYNALSHHIREKATQPLKEPNRIGTFTEKKVSDWVQYCEQYLKALESAFTDVEDKNKEIEEKIQAFIKSVPGCKVSRYNNSTYVDTKLFYVTFEHHKGEKYLNTKIEYRGKLEDITQMHALLLAQ